MDLNWKFENKKCRTQYGALKLKNELPASNKFEQVRMLVFRTGHDNSSKYLGSVHIPNSNTNISNLFHENIASSVKKQNIGHIMGYLVTELRNFTKCELSRVVTKG